jgi:hypothetical protein
MRVELAMGISLLENTTDRERERERERENGHSKHTT